MLELGRLRELGAQGRDRLLGRTPLDLDLPQPGATQLELDVAVGAGPAHALALGPQALELARGCLGGLADLFSGSPLDLAQQIQVGVA